MPHRKRSSFRDLDELVKLSPHQPQPKRQEKADPRHVGDVHDLLFESAWRKAREEQDSRFSSW
jgi:hypothetical protein